jgi:hypothetical protein
MKKMLYTGNEQERDIHVLETDKVALESNKIRKIQKVRHLKRNGGKSYLETKYMTQSVVVFDYGLNLQPWIITFTFFVFKLL